MWVDKLVHVSLGTNKNEMYNPLLCTVRSLFHLPHLYTHSIYSKDIIFLHQNGNED